MFSLDSVRKLSLFLSAFASALCVSGGASAQTWTQTGAGPFSWNAPANWSAGVPNAASASALFTTLGGPATQAITLDATITIGSLDLSNSATSYTFTNGTGGSLTFDNGGATAATVTVGAGSLAQIINASIVVAPTQTAGLAVTNNGSNLLTFGGTINLNANPLAVAGSGNTTMSGIVSGTGALTKNGAGTLTLSALNTFNGGITVNAGTLALTTSGGGTGVIRGVVTVNAGATLTASSTNAFGFTAGAKVDVLNVNGGTVTSTANGDQGWALTYNLTGATLNATGGANSLFSMGGGSAVNVLASATTTTFNGQVRLRESNVGNALVFTVADGGAAVDLNINGVVAASGGTDGATRALTKEGPGFMQMLGVNTYAGPTNVNAGTLQIGNGTTSGGLASTTIVNNGTFLLNPGTTVPTLPGSISGTGTFSKIGPNAATLTGLAHTQALNVNAGTLRFRAASATTITAATVNVTDGATMSVTPFNTATTAMSVGTLVLGTTTGTNLNFELLGNTTPAPLAVTGTFTTAGTTPVNVGSTTTLAVGQFPLIQHAGTIGGAGFGGLAMGALPVRVVANLVNNTGANTVDLNVTAFDTIRWTGAANGTWDINATQNWQTVTGGAATTYLQPGAVGDFVTFNDQAAGNFTVNVASPVTPAGVTVDNTAGTPYTFAGSAIAGTFNLIKSGAGTLTVANDNTYTGGTTINAGTVLVGNGGTSGSLGTGPIANAGTLTVDRTGNLTTGAINGAGAVSFAVTGNLVTGAITSTGALAFNVGGNLNTGAITPSVPLILNVTGNTTTGALTSGQPITFNAGGTLATGAIANNGGLTVNNSVAATLGSVISGTGTVTKQGAGNLTLSNAGNSFSGNLTVATGTLIASTGSTTASANSNLGNKDPLRTITINSGATLSFTVNNVFTGGGASAAALPTLIVNGTMTSTRYNAMPNLVLNGGVLTQNSTDSGGYQGYQFLGSVTVGGTTASTISTGALNKANHLLPAGTTFTVADAVPGAASLLVSAPLTNGSGDYSGVGVLTKAGPGTMALSGVNTYTGATTIDGGTLAVGVAGTGSITSAVTVNTGGTLAGSGTVTGAVAVASGGTLAPGNSPGIFTVAGNVTLAAGSTFRVELNGNTPGNTATSYDQLLLTATASTLDLGGATLNATLGYTPVTGPSGDKLFIAVLNDAGSTLTGQFNGVAQDGTVTIGGFTAQVSYIGDSSTGNLTGGNDLVVYNFVPVPEPASVFGVAALVAGSLAMIRRRRRDVAVS